MLMQIIPGAQGHARSNLLSATPCSPPRVVLYKVAKHACKGVLLTASHSKCMSIPFLEGVAVTARRKGACHPARETKTLGIYLFQLEFQEQSMQCSSLCIS